MTNTSNTEYTGTSGICPNCYKPYSYVGDIVGDMCNYICCCNVTRRVKPPSKPTPHPPFGKDKQLGWVCPKCGKVISPSIFECYSCNGKREEE